RASRMCAGRTLANAARAASRAMPARSAPSGDTRTKSRRFTTRRLPGLGCLLDGDAVAPVLLGLVEALVDQPHQLFEVGGRLIYVANTAADRHAKGVVARHYRPLADALANLLDEGCGFLRIDGVEDDRELLAADTRDCAAVPDHLTADLRTGADRCVSGSVTKTVVNGLEPANVDER